jgi:transposase InsO family protein
VTGSQRQALMLAGVSRSTWHYRLHPRGRVVGPIPQKDRAYPSRIDETERPVIAEKITTGWAAGHSVDHTFASTWDEGVMLASRQSWRGVAFKAYSIIDIYSRKLVGCRVEDREVDQLAVQMFQDAFAEHGMPQVVHADSGPAMRSTLLKDFLQDLDIGQTHNRAPRTLPQATAHTRTLRHRRHQPPQEREHRNRDGTTPCSLTTPGTPVSVRRPLKAT